MRVLLLVVLPVVAAFSIYAVDVDAGKATVDVLATTGQRTTIATTDAEASMVAVSAEDKSIFVSNGTHLSSLELDSGASKSTATLPAGGKLVHLAYDYKHHADDAPGYSLYGLWETDDMEVSLVHLDKVSLEMKVIGTMNTTGHVKVAYLGLPKIEPQWGEPEMKHYAVIQSPAGKRPAEGDVIAFFRLAGGAPALWNYVQKGVNVEAFAINYDGGRPADSKAHNCYCSYSNSTGSYVAIIHMRGPLQEVLSATAMSPVGARGGAVMDMETGVFYVVEKDDSAKVFLNGYSAHEGQRVSSSPLPFTPRAISMVP